MDAAWDSSAFIVLSSSLVLNELTGTPGKEWASVECARKEAYGCGKNGQKLVEGLTLYVRRLDYADLTSSLSIRLSDEALRIIEAELDVPSGGLEVQGAVTIADRQLLVLIVLFRRQEHIKRVYYVVYDSTDASLYMIPYIPDDLEAAYTTTPVPKRTAEGQDPELVLMARKFWPQLYGDRDLLCVCTPATNSASDSIGPWRIKVHHFPELSEAFSADVMFSYEGKVFWADLAQGLVCGDLRTGGSVVDFVFINLPDGYQINISDLPEYGLTEPPKMGRTIGCVRGSIKFVCINRRSARPGNEMLNVWTLDLDHRRWKEDKGFPCPWKVFWKQVDFMNAELRDVEPQYPILMPDGALCLLLPNMRQRRRGLVEADYICSFDTRSKSPQWFGRVRDYDTIGPVILPYNLFAKCYPPPPPRERKLPTRKRELPSISRQMRRRSPAVA